jgi:hypothetical protein
VWVPGDQRHDVGDPGQGDEELVVGISGLGAGCRGRIRDHVGQHAHVGHEPGNLVFAEPVSELVPGEHRLQLGQELR